MKSVMTHWFNYRGYSEHPHIKAQAEHLVSEMLGQRVRQPSSKRRSKLVRWMTVALAGLQLSGAYQRQDICITLNRNHYTGRTRRNPIFQPELLRCLQWLVNNDYLVKTRNHSFNAKTGYARPATYQLSRKWLDTAVRFPPPPPGTIIRNPECIFIEVRDEHGLPLPTPHHPDLRVWEERLRAYDRFTQSHVFEYQGVRQEAALFSLTRIFSRGSYDKGGRFYSAFQQWPSAKRQQLTIDGVEVVEVDYKSLHPSLLYQRIGVKMPDDPYSVPGFDRSTVKRAFNILINRSKTGECWRSFGYYLGLEKEPAMVLEQALRALHSPVEGFLGTGIGLDLQRYDSTLCEAVIDYMMIHAGSIVLPIHDSFVVKVSDLKSLSEALKYAEVVAANKYGVEPRNPIWLESESLGKGAFTDAALRDAFPGIQSTTWEEIEIDGDDASEQLKSAEDARLEGYVEDSVSEDFVG